MLIDDIRATLFNLFLEDPGGALTAAEIGERIGRSARSVGAAVRMDATGFRPDGVEDVPVDRWVGTSYSGGNRQVTAYRLSRAGIAAQLQNSSI